MITKMTTKQAQVVEQMEANGGINGELLARIGYSKAIQRNPLKVRESQAIKQFIKDQLPLTDAFKAHREAFKANKWNDFTGEREADHSVRLRAAVEAYKVHGLGQQSLGNNTQINISFDGTGYIPPNNLLKLKPTKK